MRRRLPFHARAVLASALVIALPSPGNEPGEESGRIAYLVTTIEAASGEERVVSQARVDGPPGTDFTVHLDSPRFEMTARFLTDRTGPESLTLRSKLETRRLHGTSERNLPLYEEDVQESAVDLRFRDRLLLFPFGGEDQTEHLRIEIVPGPGEAPTLPGGDPRPLEIDLIQPAPGGIVTVRAETVPHWFEVSASVLSGGTEVARGVGRVFLEEGGRIVIEPVLAARVSAPHRLRLDLTVDRFRRSRPSDHVDVSFDLVAEDAKGEEMAPPIARSWAGGLYLGSSMRYPLPKGLFESGVEAQIEIGVRLAGETREGGE